MDVKAILSGLLLVLIRYCPLSLQLVVAVVVTSVLTQTRAVQAVAVGQEILVEAQTVRLVLLIKAMLVAIA
jgi:hypothetical protein